MALKHGVWAADIIYAFVLVQPLSCFFWRGVWECWGWYVRFDCPLTGGVNETTVTTYHESVKLGARRAPAVACLEITGDWVVGICSLIGMTIINCFGPLLQKHVTPEKVSKPGYIILTRLYFLIFGLFYFGHWRGVWNLTDSYSGDAGAKANLIGLAASLGIMFVTRTSRMCQSSPWHCGLDLDEEVFEPRGWFRSKPNRETIWFWCLDQFLSLLIPLTLSIMVWRCYWNFIEAVFLPNMNTTTEEKLFRNAISIAIGVSSQLILFALSIPAANLSRRLDREPVIFKIIWEDFCYLFINGSSLFIWFGVYNIVETNIYPDTIMGSWICLAIGFGGSALILGARSNFDHSVDIDGELVDGEALTPELPFFHYWFKDRLEADERNKVAAQTELTGLNSLAEGNSSLQAFQNNGFADGKH